MYCPRCAADLVDGASFCGSCGTPIHAQAAASVSVGLPPRYKRYATIAGILVVVFLLFLCNFTITLVNVRSPVALILSIILAVIPAVFYSGLVISLDRFEREPALALLGAFLWGALVAAAFSAIMNTMFGLIVGSLLGKDAAAFLQSGVSAPIMEEASKGAALLLIYFYLRDDFDNILDGIVYGSLIGIGFAMTENISYFGRSFQQGELLALGANFYVRAVLGGLTHASFTGFTGVGLGYARETKSPIRKIIAPVLGFVVAMTLHGLWNIVPAGLIASMAAASGVSDVVYLLVIAPISAAIFISPAVLTLLVTAIFVLRRESRIVTEQLQPEMQAGLISPDEYRSLTSIRRRLGAQWRTVTVRGIGPWWALRDFQQVTSELAFRKWHASRGETPKRAQKGTSESDYRRRIVELRARL